MKDRWVKKWFVESRSESGKNYTVAQDANGNWGCSCKGWIFGHNRPTYSDDNEPHISMVRAALLGGWNDDRVLTLAQAVIRRLLS